MAGDPGATDRPATRPFADLAHRYRFSEQSTSREVTPGQVGAYRVTARETFREGVEEGPKGPPARVRQVEYTERPAEVSGLGIVTSTIRGYERFQSLPDESGPLPRRCSTAWSSGITRSATPCRRSSAWRAVGSASASTTWRAHQIFVPGLAALLPSNAVRIGDSWRIPPKGAQALLGEPDTRASSLAGRFVELRRPVAGASLLAILSVAGKIQTPLAETLVNAEIVFTFTPARPDSAKKAADDALVDARARSPTCGSRAWPRGASRRRPARPPRRSAPSSRSSSSGSSAASARSSAAPRRRPPPRRRSPTPG